MEIDKRLENASRISVFRQHIRSRFDRLFCAPSLQLERIGGLCTWVVMPKLITPNGIVLSGGVGQDIGFEKDLVTRFSCQVHLFDPSPTGIRTMSLPQNSIPGITFRTVGLAGSPGQVEFSAPRDDNEGSFTVSRKDLRPKFSFRCESVVSYIRENRLGVCQLLKLDIEGFEYGVIDDVLAAGMVVPQICVEFHHFLPGIPLRRTVLQFAKLYRAGYRIASKTRCDYLFVHRDFFPAS